VFAWTPSATAIAQSDSVTVDPGSPSAKEYALPLDQARNDAAGGGGAPSGQAGAPAAAPLFGQGIRADRKKATTRKHRQDAASGGSASPPSEKPSTPKTSAPAAPPASAGEGLGATAAVGAGGAGVLALSLAGALVLRRRRLDSHG
jgi:hypothetical protein